MKIILNVYKPVGITPLELIQKVRKVKHELMNEKIGYAGRLDPLAHGVMLLMIGDTTKERDTYLNLEKVYEFEVLFGIETDTYDVLGLVQTKKYITSLIVNDNVNLFVSKHVGTFLQSYPPYSSKTVHGKALFRWARENRLPEIKIPKRKIVIESFEVLSQREMRKKDLEKRVFETVELINGDFRQDETVERWKNFFTKTNRDQFQTMKFRINCSSGTYVRGIVHELGQTLGTGAIALDILRTNVGAFDLRDSLQVSTD